MKTYIRQLGNVVVVIAVTVLFSGAIPISARAVQTLRTVPKAVQPVCIILTTNATSADIQEALDKLPDAGGEVDLPAGEFAITQPIVLQRDYETLRGAGDTTILRLASNADCPV